MRKQLVEEGFAALLTRKQHTRPSAPRIFDGEKEAKLIALSCSAPPKGYARWTLLLLEQKVVKLNIIDANRAVTWLHRRLGAEGYREILEVAAAQPLTPTLAPELSLRLADLGVAPHAES